MANQFDAVIAALSAQPEALAAETVGRLRHVAEASTNAIVRGAKQLLQAQLKTPVTGLLNGIESTEYPSRREFVVTSEAPSNQPRNVPLFFEFGTVKQPARPYMRPAREAENPRYQAACARVAEDAVKAVIG